MKIEVHPYNPNWAEQFSALKTQLKELLKNYSPIVEHVGSTSVNGLAAKPIIDVLVGLSSLEELDETVHPLTTAGFIYYKAFNPILPERRFFVGLTPDATSFPSVFEKAEEIPHEVIHPYRLAHIHVWKQGSSAWNRHLAFRDYLRVHSDVCEAYGQLKLELSEREWKNGMEYNDGKNDFIKKHERLAIEWYKTQ